MDIHLKNIGIIQDSAIKINGLTVITGQNNSGKTTVGKVLYALIDSVSNIEQKSVNDRYLYAVKQIRKAYELFPFCIAFRRGRKHIKNECMRIFFSNEYEDLIHPEKIDLYLSDLIFELELFDITEGPYPYILDRYWHLSGSRGESILSKFDSYKGEAISILLDTQEYISSDPSLIHYTRQSINAALTMEFYGQIQPAAFPQARSSIEMRHRGETCFKININDNEISNPEPMIYYGNSPYKQAYFIDNPYLLDEPAYRKPNKYTITNNSYLSKSRLVTHDNKLRFLLDSSRPVTIFEEGVLDERYRLVKEKIDSILPGEFTIKDGERFYVKDNIQLNAGNLATGSKMFSILKILLERGKIDKNTLLILDEPESHLHPQWQNSFVEIIILLVKEIGCHVLLTTHSSHFMLAVDAYMRKYEITDLCNFYQTQPIDGGPFVSYKCVNDSLHLIYQDFVTYLSDVKSLRNLYLTNDVEE